MPPAAQAVNASTVTTEEPVLGDLSLSPSLPPEGLITSAEAEMLMHIHRINAKMEDTNFFKWNTSFL